MLRETKGLKLASDIGRQRNVGVNYDRARDPGWAFLKRMKRRALAEAWEQQPRVAAPDRRQLHCAPGAP